MVNHIGNSLGLIISILIISYVVVWSLLQTFNANPLRGFYRVWAQSALYYLAFTMPWWALVVAVLGVIGWLPGWVVLLLLVIVCGYFYIAVMVPNQLQTKEQHIDLGLKQPWRVAVMADLKVGVLGGKPRHIQKWINSLADLEVDAVIITGDCLYHPGADLVGQLMLFKTLNKPVYAVMSAADLEYQSQSLTKLGQPLLEDTLSGAFVALDITDLSQSCVMLPALVLCGWQENNAGALTISRSRSESELRSAAFERDDKPCVAKSIAKSTQPVIVLAASYQSSYELPSCQPRPLVITAAKRGQKTTQGLHQHASAQVFVATGVGISGWPFRLTKPTIDILTVR